MRFLGSTTYGINFKVIVEDFGFKVLGLVGSGFSMSGVEAH